MNEFLCCSLNCFPRYFPAEHLAWLISGGLKQSYIKCIFIYMYCTSEKCFCCMKYYGMLDLWKYSYEILLLLCEFLCGCCTKHIAKLSSMSLLWSAYEFTTGEKQNVHSLLMTYTWRVSVHIEQKLGKKCRTIFMSSISFVKLIVFCMMYLCLFSFRWLRFVIW